MAQKFERKTAFLSVSLLGFALLMLFYQRFVISVPNDNHSHSLHYKERKNSLNYFSNHLKTSSGKPAQDDLKLLNLIREHYLIAPAPLTRKLSLMRKIWQSPVTAKVLQILGEKTGGVFVEAGVLDGEHLSNSLKLENRYNWTGLLVEAGKSHRKQLISKNRHAWIAPVGLSPYNYPTNITMMKSKGRKGKSRKRGGSQIQVPKETVCFPLFSLVLAALNRTEIDFLSLKVGGAEWLVLRTIPFDKLRVKVISVKMGKDAALRDRTTSYLNRQGFSFEGEVKSTTAQKDGIFVHGSVSNKTKHKS